MKKFLTGFLVLLLILLAIGSLAFGLGLFSSDDTDDEEYQLRDFIRVTFVVRGEVFQIHHVSDGYYVVPPWVHDDLFHGWAFWGEAEAFDFCCCDSERRKEIEHGTIFVALLPHEELFEYEIPAISTPSQIELNQPTFIVHEDATGSLRTVIIVGEGTLTFQPQTNTIRVLHNGAHVGDLWWSPTATMVLRGYSIG